MRAFISYRHQDAASFAGWLRESLMASLKGLNVFIDTEISPGRHLVAEISRASSSSDMLLPVITPKWIDMKGSDGRRKLDDPADWVRMEIASALERGLLVIPLLVSGAAMPKPSELPNQIAEFGYCKGLELRESRWDDDVRRLVATVEAELGSTGEPVVVQKSGWRSYRWQGVLAVDPQTALLLGDRAVARLPGFKSVRRKEAKLIANLDSDWMHSEKLEVELQPHSQGTLVVITSSNVQFEPGDWRGRNQRNIQRLVGLLHHLGAFTR